MTLSAFDSLFREVGNPAMMEQLGQTVVYLDPEQDPVTLAAIVEASSTEEQDMPSGIVRRQVRRVTVSTDTTLPTGGIANPAESCELTIDGVFWAIEAVETMTGSLARLRCVRLARSEVSKQGYRGKGR